MSNSLNSSQSLNINKIGRFKLEKSEENTLVAYQAFYARKKQAHPKSGIKQNKLNKQSSQSSRSSISAFAFFKHFRFISYGAGALVLVFLGIFLYFSGDTEDDSNTYLTQNTSQNSLTRNNFKTEQKAQAPLANSSASSNASSKTNSTNASKTNDATENKQDLKATPQAKTASTHKYNPIPLINIVLMSRNNVDFPNDDPESSNNINKNVLLALDLYAKYRLNRQENIYIYLTKQEYHDFVMKDLFAIRPNMDLKTKSFRCGTIAGLSTRLGLKVIYPEQIELRNRLRNNYSRVCTDEPLLTEEFKQGVTTAFKDSNYTFYRFQQEIEVILEAIDKQYNKYSALSESERKKAYVQDIQQILQSINLYQGAIDGVLGKDTATAMGTFLSQILPKQNIPQDLGMAWLYINVLEVKIPVYFDKFTKDEPIGNHDLDLSDL